MILAAAVVSVPVQAVPQESPAVNAAKMRKYFEPRSISELEWQLLEFNVNWQGAFTGSVDYITSFPVGFDYKLMRFVAAFRVSEKRDSRDTEPFSTLPRHRREAVLQDGIAHLKNLLAMHFPELTANPNLLYVEFKFRSSGGGSSIVAKYENGTLLLSE